LKEKSMPAGTMSFVTGKAVELAANDGTFRIDRAAVVLQEGAVTVRIIGNDPAPIGHAYGGCMESLDLRGLQQKGGELVLL
jgi:hypothetical protein